MTAMSTLRLIQTIVVLGATVAFVLLGCDKNSEAKPPKSDKSDAKLYRAKASPLAIKVGEKGTATLRIEPNEGLHFNEEFPADFALGESKLVRADKPKASKAAGDVTIDGNAGKVTIALAGVAAGTEKLAITGNFSVCSDTQCHILRGEKLTLDITVH